MATLMERFLAKYAEDVSSGCWVWTASTNHHGYGQIQRGGRGLGCALAHRVAWELFRGPIGAGLEVLHRCDNPGCVNPEHLFLGTQADNIADMDAKGRGRRTAFACLRGEQHPNARLTAALVRQIRASTDPHRALARRFGVSHRLVMNVRRRRIWTHV